MTPSIAFNCCSFLVEAGAFSAAGFGACVGLDPFTPVSFFHFARPVIGPPRLPVPFQPTPFSLGPSASLHAPCFPLAADPARPLEAGLVDFLEAAAGAPFALLEVAADSPLWAGVGEAEISPPPVPPSESLSTLAIIFS